MSDDTQTAQTFSTFDVPDGQVALWWLGQSGFALRSGKTNLLLDPFLSHNPDRVTEAPIEASDCGWVTVVACTHQHIDHFDAPTVKTISETAPNCTFVVPEPIVSMATDLGIDASRVIGAQPGESIELGDITLHPVPACHGIHMSDAYTEGQDESNGLVRFLGYVVEAGGTTVYHAGDTLAYDGLVETLKPLGVNLALLPINGRSFFREQQDLVGNMGPDDCAELCLKIGAQTVIPMHYDAFPFNLGYPDMLVQIVRNRYPDLSVMVPSRHQPFLYGAITTKE
jgi:L-ascorbate 6-phosphate lactonase